MMNPYLTEVTIAELDAAVLAVARAHKLKGDDQQRGPGAAEVSRFAARCSESREFMEWAGTTAMFAAKNAAEGHPEAILMAAMSAFCIGMEIGAEIVTAAQQKPVH